MILHSALLLQLALVSLLLCRTGNTEEGFRFICANQQNTMIKSKKVNSNCSSQLIFAWAIECSLRIGGDSGFIRKAFSQYSSTAE